MQLSGNGAKDADAVTDGSMDTADLLRETLVLFDQLIEIDAPLRIRELEALAQSRPELHRRVLALLAASQAVESANFLWGPKDTNSVSNDFQFRSGDTIGVYRLDSPIGRGGMGEVWLAYRTDGAYGTPVALKLLHVHLAAGTGRERFVREGRILGSLSHPNIARMLDAGVSAQGQHFLVIEHIEGSQVDRWCDERVLDIDSRIRLFLQICSAVAYAHAHLIVHRDLKPSNILVSADGTVKLLDFGIAKLIEPERQEAAATELTRLGGGALTPDYAAPEQVLGESITTATDVYALGALLYRLLTGRRPYGETGKAAMQLAFDVLQTDPLLPSQSVLKETIGTVSAEMHAAQRATVSRNLSRSLRGDLDAIVCKALRKEPAARYTDARALADDLQRFLDHQPVLAREGARSYVWRRFVRRNWIPLTAVTTVFLMLVAGIGGFAWQAREIQREAHRANAVTDFLISVFRASDPRIAQDKPRGEITARELLDNSADRIATHFAADPDTEIRLLGITAGIYRELGDAKHYLDLHEQQINLARRLYGELHPAIVEGLLDEAEADIGKDQENEALQLLDRADPLIRRSGSERTITRARWLVLRAEALSLDGRSASEMETSAQRAVQLYERLAPNDFGYVNALAELGALSYISHDYPAAADHYYKAVTVAATIPNRNDGDLTVIYTGLALSYEASGDLDEAEATYRKTEDLIIHTYGKNHRNYWKILADHALFVNDRGNRAQALNMFAEIIPLIPDNTPMGVEIAEMRYEYGVALTADGQPLPAIPMLEESEKFFVNWPLNEYTVRRGHKALGDAYDGAGRPEDARRELKTALDQYLTAEPLMSDNVYWMRERWARFLLEHDNAAGAETELHEIVDHPIHSNSSNRDTTIWIWTDLAKLSLQRKDQKSAVEQARRAVTAYEHMVGSFDVRSGPYAWRIYAEALLTTGDAKNAYSWAVKALTADRQYYAPDSAEVTAVKRTLREVERAQAQK